MAEAGVVGVAAVVGAGTAGAPRARAKGQHCFLLGSTREDV